VNREPKLSSAKGQNFKARIPKQIQMTKKQEYLTGTVSDFEFRFLFVSDFDIQTSDF